MSFVAATDTGMKRSGNEDFLFASDKETGMFPNLYIVADGMGGHAAGEVASKLAVESVVNTIRNEVSGDPGSILVEAVNIANEEVLSLSRFDAGKAGMGTTMVICSVYEDHALIANVGDSRLYIFDGELNQITRDHTVVSEMIRLGSLSKASAKYHPKRHMLTRAVGVGDDINVDVFKIPIDKTEQILMTTDGLTNMMEDHEIKEILCRDTDVKTKVKTLVSTANEKGGDDNITLILIDLKR